MPSSSIETIGFERNLMTIAFPYSEKPEDEHPVIIEEGILWFRLPLPMALDHVNVFVFEEDHGWTIIDTGFYTRRGVEIWQNIIAKHLDPKPVNRVIVTHYHPDHIGMAGWLGSEFNAEIVTTRISWLLARMLVLDVQEKPTDEIISYFKNAGMTKEKLEERKNSRPFNFADVVHHIPLGYTRISEADTIMIGKRNWTVRIGHGHAPSHATFWSEDGSMCLGGDQFLPDITPNIGVYATEPEANPLKEWLESCRIFYETTNNETLVLAGHKSPFRGVKERLGQLIDHHKVCLDSLLSYLSKPRTVIECFEILFGRRIPEREFGLATAEAYAHLNFLWKEGKISRTLHEEGYFTWQLK